MHLLLFPTDGHDRTYELSVLKATVLTMLADAQSFRLHLCNENGAATFRIIIALLFFYHQNKHSTVAGTSRTSMALLHPEKALRRYNNYIVLV